MNYNKIYNTLINNASMRSATMGYTEKHHILPRSMGGTDSINNLVTLTAREHFLAHLLLWKMYRNPQMTRAIYMMSGKSAYKTGRMYRVLKEEFINNQTNKQIYTFQHIISGELFTGTRKEFRLHACISFTECATIVRNGYICRISDKFNTNGVDWKLQDACVGTRIPHNTDLTTYEFVNVYTDDVFIGTRKEFDSKISYRSYEVVNKIRIVNGWKLKGAIFSKIPQQKKLTSSVPK